MLVFAVYPVYGPNSIYSQWTQYKVAFNLQFQGWHHDFDLHDQSECRIACAIGIGSKVAVQPGWTNPCLL